MSLWCIFNSLLLFGLFSIPTRWKTAMLAWFKNGAQLLKGLGFILLSGIFYKCPLMTGTGLLLWHGFGQLWPTRGHSIYCLRGEEVVMADISAPTRAVLEELERKFPGYRPIPSTDGKVVVIALTHMMRGRWGNNVELYMDGAVGRDGLRWRVPGSSLPTWWGRKGISYELSCREIQQLWEVLPLWSELGRLKKQ